MVRKLLFLYGNMVWRKEFKIMKKFGVGLILLAIMVLIFNFAYQKVLDKNNNDTVESYIEDTSIKTEIEETNVVEEPIVEEKKITYQINYTAVLEIPTINLKRGVVDNTKNFKSINYAISVDNSSKYPNEVGNFILYAHSGNSSIGFFTKLVNVNINDDVYVYYNGIKYHYSIFDKYDIEKTGKAEVITSNKEKYITLITCNPKRKGYQVILIGKYVDEMKY